MERVRGRPYFYSRPCGRGDLFASELDEFVAFLLTPLREGRLDRIELKIDKGLISTHAPAGGATRLNAFLAASFPFLLTPLREGRLSALPRGFCNILISTHAPAGGATFICFPITSLSALTFLLTPLREGRPALRRAKGADVDFYSRPCGRGDRRPSASNSRFHPFLLTPLREGRPFSLSFANPICAFLLTPLREGRPKVLAAFPRVDHFYSRPCGRGDDFESAITGVAKTFLLTPLREGRQHLRNTLVNRSLISTHAPAGGATLFREVATSHFVHFYSRPCGRGDRCRRLPESH